MQWVKRYLNIIEIQDKYVKCLKILRSSGKYSVLKTAIGELKPDSKDDVIDHIAYVIKSLLLETDSYPPKYLILSLNGRDAMIRLLELPLINNEKFVNLDNMIRYELSTHLPLNVDQTCYDYQILKIDNEKTKALTVAIKRSILTRLLSSFALSGIYPNAITISSLVLFNVFALKGLINDDPIGLIHLRSSGGDIVISEFGHVNYARSFSIQEGADKSSILKELNNSFEAYYKFKPKAQRNFASNIYIVLEEDQLPFGITEDDLSKTFSESRYNIYKDFDDLTLAMAIIGSTKAHDKIPTSLVRVNLLDQIIKEDKLAKKKAIRAKLAHFTPALILIFLLVIFSMLTLQNYRLKERLSIAIDKAEKANEKLEDISKLESTAEDLDGRIETFKWLFDKYPMLSYRMYKIATEIPDSIWLKEIYIPEIKTNKKKESVKYSLLYVTGYAKDQSHIDYFIDRLRKCDCFSSVRQESTTEVLVSNERSLEFKIALISKPETQEYAVK